MPADQPPAIYEVVPEDLKLPNASGDTVYSLQYCYKDDCSVIVFSMEAESCLRGPLSFFDNKGKPVFKLESGITYPPDCEKK
jgi:hypothetical protein